ncbi:hypothetical protein IZ6_11830 [Terrihabitans soli]|uniref:Uncharacterized protein n=1 Tax=Terrihabitans soli TaxID=708113 RepID=A0A6S6QVB5_9HYPH|nr:hypothetical protein [Terrihabitans soli]BCJ90448.1 hypothetical protein IZ6_11830 [Terrihabitans soli]
MTTASKTFAPAAVSGGSFDPLAGILGFFERLGAARRCAAAISVDRLPSKTDLKILGLDKMDFGNLPR